MIIPERFRCDAPGCGLERSETNHWHAVRKMDHGVLIQTWEQAEKDGRLGDSEFRHFCGQTHALQYVSSLMGEK